MQDYLIKLIFEPLVLEYLELLYCWLNKQHVQLFYSPGGSSFEDINKKYLPRLMTDSLIKSYIIYYNNRSIGYIQYYPAMMNVLVKSFFPLEISERAAGLDLFIGEEEFLGKGLGKSIVNNFLERIIWPIYEFCIVDPDIRNTSSIRMFECCEFKQKLVVSTQDNNKAVVQSILLIKRG